MATKSSRANESKNWFLIWVSTRHLLNMFHITAQVRTLAASIEVSWLVLGSMAALAWLSTVM